MAKRKIPRTRLRRLRDALGLRAVDAAAAAGMNPSTLSNLENENKGVGRDTLALLAKGYEVSMDGLHSYLEGEIELSDLLRDRTLKLRSVGQILARLSDDEFEKLGRSLRRAVQTLPTDPDTIPRGDDDG